MKACLLLCCIILISCGGGGGGSSAGTGGSSAPTISIVLLTPAQLNFLDVRIDFADSEGDIDTVTVNQYDSQHTLIDSGTASINGPGGWTSGGFTMQVDFTGLPPGDYSLEFFLTDKGGRQSNKVSRDFSAIGGFGRATNIENPQIYIYLGDTAIGDLNGDGRNDVVAIQGSNNTGLLLIYYQNASGLLDNPVTMNLDIFASGVAIGDVNNDGKADLITTGMPKGHLITQPQVLVFLQDLVTGQLQPPIWHAVSSRVGKIVIADLNSDGNNDAAVDTLSGISLFFQNSDGTIGPEVVYTTVSVYRGEIHVADMNSDGKNDIVIQNGPKELAVIFQITPGVFSDIPELYAVQTGSSLAFSTFALGDLNADGRTDVVATGPEIGNYLNIFLQNSQGTLSAPVLIQTTYDEPFGLKIADITGDGLNDIIEAVSGRIIVFPQRADHTFSSQSVFYPYQPQSFYSPSVTEALSIGDVTGDGRLDAVLAWSDEGLFVLPSGTRLFVP